MRWSGVLPQTVVSVSMGLLLSKLAIPPPSVAALLVNVQFVSVGLLLNSLYIPPP